MRPETMTHDACDAISASPTYMRALATTWSHVTHVTQPGGYSFLRTPLDDLAMTSVLLIPGLSVEGYAREAYPSDHKGVRLVDPPLAGAIL